jgi:predicted dehydrogenase
MNRNATRREFLSSTGAAGAAFLILPAWGSSPNDKLDLAAVGVAGRAGANLGGLRSENFVALCDVDSDRLGKAAKRYSGARTYADYRKMLDKEKDVDAVVVSTPDHLHAFATFAALKRGKHVYCEKPLTHSVWESREVRRILKGTKLATQMGTQIHAGNNYRRVVEIVQAGVLGAVKEVHVWLGGKPWSAGDRPKGEDPVPDNLDWNLWIGPAPMRPYVNRAYHPGRWRCWWDFGGGNLGDMGCHYIDLPHWALDLRDPVKVSTEGPPVHPEGAPNWLIVTWEFPERKGRAPVKLVWYHGGKRPPNLPKWGGNGVLFVGEKRNMIADYSKYKVLGEGDFELPKPSIPNSIGHHKEWIQACKTGSPTTCNFDYSGALTETVLLGNAAFRTGEPIEWDAANMKAKNTSKAAPFLRREYRKGWALG